MKFIGRDQLETVRKALVECVSHYTKITAQCVREEKKVYWQERTGKMEAALDVIDNKLCYEVVNEDPALRERAERAEKRATALYYELTSLQFNAAVKRSMDSWPTRIPWRSGVAATRTTYSDLEKEAAALTQENTRLKGVGFKLEKENEKLRAEMSNLEAGVKDVAKKAADNATKHLKECNDKLWAELDKITASNNHLSTENHQLKREKTCWEGDYEKLRVENAKLRSADAVLSELASERRDKIRQLENILQEANTQIDRFKRFFAIGENPAPIDDDRAKRIVAAIIADLEGRIVMGDTWLNRINDAGRTFYKGLWADIIRSTK